MSRHRRVAALATAGAGLAVALSAGSPAHASGTGLDFTVSSNGTRILTLTDLAGNTLTPASTVDASSGATDLSATVTDSGEPNGGFTVQATMSNLYGYSNGTWNCGVSLPSSEVSMATTAASTLLGGISAAGDPVFTLAGTFTGTVDTALVTAVTSLDGGAPVASTVNGTLTGTLPSGQLTESQLVAATGTLTNGTLAGLPVQIAPGSATPASFGVADQPPVGSNCAATTGTPSYVTVMTGTADPAGVTSALSGILGAGATAASVITAGYLTTDQVVTWLASPGVLTTSGVNAAALETALGANLQSVLGQITAALASISGLVQNGNYSDVPSVKVTAGQAATPGTYRGALTLTLMNTP